MSVVKKEATVKQSACNRYRLDLPCLYSSSSVLSSMRTPRNIHTRYCASWILRESADGAVPKSGLAVMPIALSSMYPCVQQVSSTPASHSDLPTAAQPWPAAACATSTRPVRSCQHTPRPSRYRPLLRLRIQSMMTMMMWDGHSCLSPCCKSSALCTCIALCQARCSSTPCLRHIPRYPPCTRL